MVQPRTNCGPLCGSQRTRCVGNGVLRSSGAVQDRGCDSAAVCPFSSRPHERSTSRAPRPPCDRARTARLRARVHVTMRTTAAVLWQRGEPLTVEDADLDPPGPGEVLVD